MLKEYKGNIFNVGADCLVNTVNTEGVMGTGLAYEIKLRYPQVFKNYEEDCKKNIVRVGELKIYMEGGQYVLNFPTKSHWRLRSKYEYIEEGLKYFLQNYSDLIESKNIRSIAFPKLGAGRGGLDWTKVREIMETYLSKLDYDLTVYICLDELSYPEGLEKTMLEDFKKLSDDSLRQECGLDSIQIKNIRDYKSINRFFELANIDGIGKKSYEKIHRYLYERALAGDTSSQLSFFE